MAMSTDFYVSVKKIQVLGLDAYNKILFLKMAASSGSLANCKSSKTYLPCTCCNAVLRNLLGEKGLLL